MYLLTWARVADVFMKFYYYGSEMTLIISKFLIIVLGATYFYIVDPKKIILK